MDDLVTYPIVTCDEETSVAAAERVIHRKVLQATITFIFNCDFVKICKNVSKVHQLNPRMFQDKPISSLSKIQKHTIWINDHMPGFRKNLVE